MTPDGTKLYVSNVNSATISVIDTATNTLVDTDPAAEGVNPIPVADNPGGIALTPDGKKAYVANGGSGIVSLIDIATNMVAGEAVQVGGSPAAFGLFIGPATAPFAGKPGAANCAGQSLSAAAQRYGGNSAAAQALGYAGVAKMQTAIRAFCKG